MPSDPVASAPALEQLKLTREAIGETRELRRAIQQETKAILDLAEAVDALREELEGATDVLSKLKVEIDVEKEVEEEAPADGAPAEAEPRA